MPYLPESERVHARPEGASPGDLNFLLTRVLVRFLGDSPRYKDYNTAIGALECAKLELYRRMVAPYEDLKLAENGDVYS